MPTVTQIYGRAVTIKPGPLPLYIISMADRRRKVLFEEMSATMWAPPYRDIVAENDAAHKANLRDLVEFL